MVGTGAQAARTAADVRGALQRQPASALTFREGAKAVVKDDAKLRTVSVAYTFAQLKHWQSVMDALVPGGSITFTDADERANTVTVGVNGPDARSSVLRHAEQAGIPRDAIKVVEANIGRRSLRDDHRPVTADSRSRSHCR